jgi:hypothetical protein
MCRESREKAQDMQRDWEKKEKESESMVETHPDLKDKIDFTCCKEHKH